MNAARPRIQLAFCLEFAPIFRFFENENVALAFPLRGVALKIFRDDAIVKLRLDRHGRGDEAVEKVIDEIGRLRVLPFRRTNRQRDLAQSRKILVGELRECDFRQSIQSAGVLSPCGRQ